MNTNILYGLFKKYVNDKVDIFGIYLYPIEISEDYIIDFKLENPNNKSYSKTSLNGWLSEEIKNFKSLVGINWIGTNIVSDKLYLNDSLQKKLHILFSEIKKIKFEGKIIYINHEFFTADMVGKEDDAFQVINNVTPIGISFNQGKTVETDYKIIIEVITEYNEWVFNNKYDETETTYKEFDLLLYDEELLVDSYWMVQYVTTKFLIE